MTELKKDIASAPTNGVSGHVDNAKSGLAMEGNVLVHHGTSKGIVTEVERLVEGDRDERFEQLCKGVPR